MYVISVKYQKDRYKRQWWGDLDVTIKFTSFLRKNINSNWFLGDFGRFQEVFCF